MEYDARELQIAEEENMSELAEEKGSMLSRVLDALHSLGAAANHSHHPR